MKICKLMLEYAQVMDVYGRVRMCPWLKDDGVIGSLLDNNMEEVWHSEKAEYYRKKLIDHDFSNCNIDECPYLSNGSVEEVDIAEIPQYPVNLALAYERVCNYRCACCYLSCESNRKTSSYYENNYGSNYDKIEDEIRKAMPYAKRLSSNGLAELFCSNRELKLLNEWDPVMPKEECTVQLETNGSMFNEENWRKIEALKDFNLKVSITVMSFDEKVYQELSGTKLPISIIEHNLEFISDLRKNNIINYLQLNTVYQERNFRTMPELVRRFLSYGADYIRLRPYAPMGEDREEIMWFKDVRNEYHPYHDEFLEIWRDPIFKDKKVHDWGGGKSSLLGKWPASKEHKKNWLMNDLLMGRKVLDAVYNKLGYSNNEVIIYGCGAVGKILAQILTDNNIKTKYFLDQFTQAQNYKGIPIYRLRKNKTNTLVIITTVERHNNISEVFKETLSQYGYSNLMLLSDVVID